MKSITFFHDKTSLIENKVLTLRLTTLKPEILRLKAALSQGYKTPYASINLPFDTALNQEITKFAHSLKTQQPTASIIVGIGGSNLGTVALHKALHGTHHNELYPENQIYFADTIDTDSINDLSLLIARKLSNNYRIILNVISKSGTTTETIANFQILLQLIQSFKNPTQHTIIVTTTMGSKLWDLGQKLGFLCIPIEENVGGRFSVFSAVSLLPLSLLNIDTQQLLAGAQYAIEVCTQIDSLSNTAALRAAMIYEHAMHGITMHNMFLFCPNLEGVGLWYRQLLGESIGKELDNNGNEIKSGITPLVSIGSTDLHSVGQLFLGGPRTMFTTFVGVANQNTEIIVPSNTEFAGLVDNIQQKSLQDIMHAIMTGTRRAYAQKKLPFSTLIISQKSEWYLGYLLQMHMIEIIYLGYLFNINPFNQPEVERYKNETHEILTHE